METTGYLLRLNYLLMTFTESLPPLFESVPLICLCVCVCVCVCVAYLFICGCAGSLLLHAFSSCSREGLLSRCSAGASHGSHFCCRVARLSDCGLSSYGTWAGCSIACGIFLDQGSNSHFLHWQVDSLPLSHQGSPGLFISLAF